MSSRANNNQYFCEGQVFAWHKETSVLRPVLFHLPQIILRKIKGSEVSFFEVVHSRTAFHSRSRTDYRQTANVLSRKLLFAKSRGSMQTVEAKTGLDRAVCSLRVDVAVSRGLLARNLSLYADTNDNFLSFHEAISNAFIQIKRIFFYQNSIYF